MWGRAFIDSRAGSGPLAPSLARVGGSPPGPSVAPELRTGPSEASGSRGLARAGSRHMSSPWTLRFPRPAPFPSSLQPGTRVLLSLSSARREQGSARPLPSCTPSAWERAGVQWVLGKCMSANPPGSKVCVLRRRLFG